MGFVIWRYQNILSALYLFLIEKLSNYIWAQTTPEGGIKCGNEIANNKPVTGAEDSPTDSDQEGGLFVSTASLPGNPLINDIYKKPEGQLQ